MRGFLSSIPDGDAGTFATLDAMRGLARQASIDPTVRATTAALVRDVPFDRGNTHAVLIRRWIEARVYFLADPTYAEALHDPVWQIKQILTRGTVGVDCDDVAMLAAAMGLSVGLKARFAVVGFTSPNAPFQHVWTELAAIQSPRWAIVDPTRPMQALANFKISRMAYREV